ncbi:MAG: hypothetical protein KBC41_01925 [Candidatus Pacebacteria bacterium]|nr:hypothetical protein [Candidatus Paceibacterota bacterium]MBP9866815.1 hypothetical protein [Candidatus Paceibacterota bacterium]
MGIKFGIAVEAYRKKLFIYLSQGKEHHCSFAEIKLGIGNVLYTESYLLYPDGVVGVLSVNNFFQFKVCRKITNIWVPTKTQMQALQGTLLEENIMFSGEYQIKEMSESDLFPRAEHTTDEMRFKNPKGAWDTVVARCLFGS